MADYEGLSRFFRRERFGSSFGCEPRFREFHSRSERQVEPFHRGIPLWLRNREFCPHL